MKITLLSTLLILVSLMVPSINGNRFVCYFPNWPKYYNGNANFGVNNINPNLCTHLIYSFAKLDPTTFKIVPIDPWGDINLNGYLNFTALKSKNPSLKTMISIGGWTDSNDGTQKYSKLVASNTNTAVFVTSVISFLQTYGFDGLDIDWEVPSTPADKAGFAKLSQALRTAFKSNYLLSAATGASVTNVDNGYDLVTLNQTMDFINIMFYEMHGTWDPWADNFAPLYKRSWETNPTINIDYIVKYYISKGLAASKVVMGIPIYGSSWSLKAGAGLNPPNTLSTTAGLPGPFIGQSGSLMYSEICYNVRYNGWKVVQDPKGQTGPYAYSPTSPIQWVGYDDPNFAVVKSQYALTNGLGGVMVWDISQDDFKNLCGGGVNPMLTAISQTILAGPITTSTTTMATTKTPAPFTCSKNGFFADPASCYTFYNCVADVAYKMSCPSGLAFNFPSIFCDLASNVPSCNASG